MTNIEPPKEPKPKRTLEEARAYQRRYYQENKARAKQYYQDNKEKLNAYVKKWQEENKERYTAVRKEHATANRKKLNAQQKERVRKAFAEDPEKVREQRRAKKARLKAKDPQAWNEKARKINAPYHKKMVSELSDAYVRQRLTRENDDSPRKISATDIPQGLVEAKRLQLMIVRSLRNEKR